MLFRSAFYTAPAVLSPRGRSFPAPPLRPRLRPSAGGGKESTRQCKRWVHPWVRKSTWRRKRQATPVSLPGKFHGQRRLVGYSPWGCKELDTTERLHCPCPVSCCDLACMHERCGASGKESTCRCRRRKRLGFDPGLERSPGEGNGNPLHYFCLGNSMDRGDWWPPVHGVAKSRT